MTFEKHRSATVTLEIVVTIQTRLVLCLRGKCNISEAQTTDESGRNINHSFPSPDLMSHRGESRGLNLSYQMVASMAECDETGDLSRMWTHNHPL